MPSSCSAADIGLTKVLPGWFCAQSEQQLVSLCGCASIDHFCILDCDDCKQSTIDRCQTSSITGMADIGFSLVFSNSSQITNVRSLGLEGQLRGSLRVDSMPHLTSLDGLQGLNNVGADSTFDCIVLANNPELESAVALGNTSWPFEPASGGLFIHSNPRLGCVPSNWPLTDQEGFIIRVTDCIAPTPAPPPMGIGR